MSNYRCCVPDCKEKAVIYAEYPLTGTVRMGHYCKEHYIAMFEGVRE